jgi:hypothetical protein
MKNFPTNAPGRPIVIVLIFICIIAGCASANRGSLRNSQEVGRAFETFHVYPNHRYWYYNQENNPYAVVGLQDPYTIEDINWKEVDPNSKTFEKVVGLVQSFPIRGSFAYGAYILDPQARQIGMWYSSLNAGIKVDPETKTVFITAAMPWVDDDGRYGSGVGVGIGTGGSGIGIRIGF